MSCVSQVERELREKRRIDFVETYGREPTESELRAFTRYLEYVKQGRNLT